MNRKIIILIIFYSLIFTACSSKHYQISDDAYVEIDTKSLSLTQFTEIIAKNINKKIIFKKKVNEKLNFQFPKEGLQKDKLIVLLNNILQKRNMTLVNMGTHYLILGGCYDEELDDFKVNNIKEAMYRYLLEDKKNNLVYYFLGFKNDDEDKKILNRLQNIRPKVLAKSMSKRYNSEEMQKITNEKNYFKLMTSGTLVHHKENGGDGVLYYISCIEKISDSKVIVTWGNYVNMLNASESDSTLELIVEKWIVTDTKLKWVS